MSGITENRSSAERDPRVLKDDNTMPKEQNSAGSISERVRGLVSTSKPPLATDKVKSDLRRLTAIFAERVLQDNSW